MERLRDGAPRVARGRDEDRQRGPVGKVVQEPGLDTGPHVLERERRAVKQLHQVQPGIAQRLHGCHIRSLERGVGLGDQAMEGHLVERVADEGPHDAKGKIDIRQALHPGDLGPGELRPSGRQIETSVAGEAGEHDVLEAERRGLPLRAVAGADVTQMKLRLRGLHAR